MLMGMGLITIHTHLANASRHALLDRLPCISGHGGEVGQLVTEVLIEACGAAFASSIQSCCQGVCWLVVARDLVLDVVVCLFAQGGGGGGMGGG